jgi:hypothetical protein
MNRRGSAGVPIASRPPGGRSLHRPFHYSVPQACVRGRRPLGSMMFQKTPKPPTSITFKTPAEIDKMRVAGRLAAEVLRMIRPHVQARASPPRNWIGSATTISSTRNRPSPRRSVITVFPNPSAPRSTTWSAMASPARRKLKKGDVLNIDITVIKDGYHGDTSQMFHVGVPPIAAQLVSRVAYEAMCIGIRWCGPAFISAISGTPSRSMPRPSTARWCASTAATVSAATFTKSPRYCTTATRRRHRTEAGHDLYHRTDGQRRPAAR